MLERYSHIRMEAKRVALEVLSGKKSEGYGTIYGTKEKDIPVYSDLSPTNSENSPQIKLEVATVPE